MPAEDEEKTVEVEESNNSAPIRLFGSPGKLKAILENKVLCILGCSL